jgi:hypothetical protein
MWEGRRNRAKGAVAQEAAARVVQGFGEALAGTVNRFDTFDVERGSTDSALGFRSVSMFRSPASVIQSGRG